MLKGIVSTIVLCLFTQQVLAQGVNMVLLLQNSSARAGLPIIGNSHAPELARDSSSTLRITTSDAEVKLGMTFAQNQPFSCTDGLHNILILRPWMYEGDRIIINFKKAPTADSPFLVCNCIGSACDISFSS